MTDELKARIAKIYELIERGATEGERQAAKINDVRMIFTNIPTCEICKECDPEKKANGTYKKRCSRCSNRYDRQGVAFIMYCDFHRFTNLGRGHITFWVCDNRVQRAPVPFGYLVGINTDELYAQMEDIGRYPCDFEKAILP